MKNSKKLLLIVTCCAMMITATFLSFVSSVPTNKSFAGHHTNIVQPV